MAKGKKKGHVRIKQKAQVRKKGEGRDSLRYLPTKTTSTDNAATFKVKLRKKNK